MPRPPQLIARDTRIRAAHSAGATIPQIAATEQINPATGQGLYWREKHRRGTVASDRR